MLDETEKGLSSSTLVAKPYQPGTDAVDAALRDQNGAVEEEKVGHMA